MDTLMIHMTYSKHIFRLKLKVAISTESLNYRSKRNMKEYNYTTENPTRIKHNSTSYCFLTNMPFSLSLTIQIFPILVV